LYDKASPKLAEACRTDQRIKDVTIELCRAGGNKQKYAEIKLEQMIVSHISLNSGSDSESFPSESISFSYGKIKWIYTQQKREDGQGGGQVTSGWDLTTNKTYA
jgi:type VI secretion system secreted protein Hcp